MRVGDAVWDIRSSGRKGWGALVQEVLNYGRLQEKM